VPRSIDVPSVLTVVPVQNTTSSNIDWIYSDSIQLSTPPLVGYFFLECYDVDGNVFYTDEMYRSANTGTIYNALVATCPWLRDSLDVWNGRHYRFTEDGIDFTLYFRGIKGPMAQFKIHTSLDTTK